MNRCISCSPIRPVARYHRLIAASLLAIAPLGANTIVNDWITNGSGTWGTATNWSAGVMPTAEHHARFGALSSANRTNTINFADPAGADPAGIRNVGAITLLPTNEVGRIIRPNNNAGHDGALHLHGIPAEIDGQPVNLLLASYAGSETALLALRNGTSTTMEVVLRSSGVIHASAGSLIELRRFVAAPDFVVREQGGSHSITKTGEGTLYMNTTSSSGYSGGTYVHGGTLLYGRTGSVGSGPVYLGKEGGGDVAFLRNLGGWDMNNDVIVVANLAGTATMGTNLLANTITMRSNGTITLGSDLILHTDMTHETEPVTINFNGDFIGSRTVTKTGIGRLGITGENASFSGDFIIAGGVVEIGFDTTVSGSSLRGTLGTGKVVNNAMLRFHRINEYVMANDISGSGSVVQAMPGTTILTGNNTYTGQTLVEAGELRIVGPLTGTSDIVVMPLAAFGMDSSGVISAPVTLMASSTATFRLGSPAQSSRLNLAGGLTYAGANLSIVLESQPQQNDVFVLVANHGAAGSLQGQFAHNGTALNEADTFTVQSGSYVTEFQITYDYNEGGFQNSVAITAISAPPPAGGDYASWRIGRFGNDTDPAGAPDARPAGQIVTNLMFHALALDLLSEAAAGVPVATAEGTITFTRRTPLATHLIVEGADSLPATTWDELAILEPGASVWTGLANLTEEVVGDGVVRVTVTDPATTGDTRFIRVRAVLP